MADLSISAVVPGGADTRIRVMQVATGETISAGDSVTYGIDSGVEKAYLADATTASGLYRARGIAMQGAAAGGYIGVAEAGPVSLTGPTLDPGQGYSVSETPGGIATDADFSGYTSATQYRIGTATTAAILNIDIRATGATT